MIATRSLSIFGRGLSPELATPHHKRALEQFPSLEIFGGTGNSFNDVTITNGLMATNVAEDVIYMVEGDIVRHRADE